MYDGLTSFFLAAFALALGASNPVIGLLGALPYAVALIAEFPGAKLVEYYRRKTILFVLLTVAGCGWVFIGLVPLLPAPLAILLALYAGIKFLEYTTVPAWTTLAADVIPARVRGAFFGKRNMVIGLTGMIASVIAGAFLDWFPDGWRGFAVLFAIGAGVGVLAAASLRRVKEPEYQDHQHHSLREFLSVRGRFRRFVFAMSVFNFAYMLASPFFTVYLLKNLGMSYTYFVIATAATTVCRIAASGFIGRVSDRYGDKPVAILSVLGTAIVPLSFIFITEPVRWLAVPALALSGAVWAGVDLSTFNLLLSLSGGKAARAGAYTTLTSIPLIIAPVIGGFIAERGDLVLAGIPLVFAISAALRAASSLVFLGLKEQRVQGHSVGELFRDVVFRHPAGGHVHMIRGVRRMVRKARIW